MKHQRAQGIAIIGQAKRRAVVILHPDFDQPGAAGVRAAQEYATWLVEALKQIGKRADRDLPVDHGIQFSEYMRGFEHMVRNLPKDLL